MTPTNRATMTKTPSLSTTVAGIRLDTCVYNASGPRTGSSAALVKIAASESGAVLTKSATLQKQTGNPQPRTWHETDTNGASLNSEGLPNAGIDYYIDINTVEESLEDTNKPYMVSISGKSLDDNLVMLRKIVEFHKQSDKIAAIELNLACPNVIGKPIIAYDFDQMKTVLKAVSNVRGITSVPLGVKMPPYLDVPLFQQAASILNDYSHVVKYVACINTIGNALAVDVTSEAPVISANGGLAGLSGRAVKYTALANVRQMRLLLKDDIDVVGVGGVESGTDAFEMILCGASAVQVGTCHWKEGPKCFDRICAELRDIMAGKGYAAIDDFRGKLKPWSKEGAAATRAARKNKPTLLHSSSSMELLTKTGINPYTFVSIAVAVVVVSWALVDHFGPPGWDLQGDI